MTLGDNKFSKRKAALAATFTLAFAACGPVIGCSGDDTEVTEVPDTGAPDTGAIDTGTPVDSTPPDTGTPPDTAPEDTGPTEFAATPVLMPPPGMYSMTTAVSITSATAGATIHYTTDGTEPNTSSPKYSSPINVTSGTVTIKAMAVAAGFKNSAVVTGIYTVTLIGGKPVAPTMTPRGGTYNNDQTVSLTTTTAGATICYTVDGATPACNATTGGCAGSTSTYSAASPVPVNATGRTIKAIACIVGNASDVTTESYTLTVANPTWAPADGTTRDTNFTAFASETTIGADVRYTIDGTNPDCATIGTKVLATGVAIDANTTIKSIGCKVGYNPSMVVTTTYKVRAAAPGFTVAAGKYTDDQSVGLTGTGGIMCYTTNGTDPACASATACAAGSTLYSTAIAVTKDNTTVKAVRCVAGYEPSPIASAKYDLQVADLTFNPVGDGTKTFTDVPSTGVEVCTTTDPFGDVAGTANAVQIFTTTDGSNPVCAATGGVTTASTAGKSCVTVPKTFSPGATIKAIACKKDYLAAPIASASYPSTVGLPQPDFHLDTATGATVNSGGGYYDDIKIFMTAAPADATICYTTDATVTPSCNAAKTGCATGVAFSAASPLTVNVSGTQVKAMACKPGNTDSTVRTATYSFFVTDMDTDPAGGTHPYGTPITFKLIPSAGPIVGVTTSGVTFRYTTDGVTVPTCSSGSTSTGNFGPLTADVVIKVIGCKLGFTPTTVLTRSFDMSGIGTPTFSPLPVTGYPVQTPAADGSITNAPTVTVTTVSGAAPEAIFCYAVGAGDASAVTDPACSASGAVSCTSGTPAPAGTPLSVTLPAGTTATPTVTTLKARACANTADGRISTVQTATYRFRTSNVKFTPADWTATAYAAGAIVRGPGNFLYAATKALTATDAGPVAPSTCTTTPTAAGCVNWSVRTTADVTFALDAADTPGGATTGAKLCYRTDGVNVTWDTSATAAPCTPATGLPITCVTTTSATVTLNKSADIRTAVCKAGFATTTNAYAVSFAAYSYAGTPTTNVNDFTSVETFATSGSDTAYVSWTGSNIVLGWKGSSVDNTSANFLHYYFSQNPTTGSSGSFGSPADGGNTTTTQHLAAGMTPAGTIPFAGDVHLIWKADNTFLAMYVWNGAVWAQACGTGTATSCGVTVSPGGGAAGANSFVKLTFARSVLGYQAADAYPDLFKVTGGISNGTTNTVGIIGTPLTRWIEADLNTTTVPNAAGNIK
jgi:hypothetical protein